MDSGHRDKETSAPLGLEPELPSVLQQELLEWMIRTRAFDELMVSTWKQGKGLGGTFSERGHEAISVGAGMALEPDDVVAPMHRDLGTYLVRGMTPEAIFGNLLGKLTGPSRGRDANLHGMTDMTKGIVGFISHIPQALPTTLGLAMSFRYRDQPRAALTFVGDGGTCSGVYHETLNMAALYQAPMVVVIENNQYAYSTPLAQEMKETDLAARARSYGIPAHLISGNEVEEVYQAVRSGIELARSGGGPTVIVAITMRMLGHAIHDGAEYVPAEQLAEWAKLDPISQYSNYLCHSGVMSTDDVSQLQTKAKQWAQDALTTAQAAPSPVAGSVSEGVYA